MAVRPFRAVDEYLKFIQKNFNTDSGEYKDIDRILTAINNDKSIVARIKKIASKLKETLSDIFILREDDNYTKFDKLGNLGFDEVREVYTVTNDIIKDINKARNWLKSYKTFIRKTRWDKSDETTHEQLIALGKSILGRAVELAPMKTGYLRSSGILIDMGDYITIAFTAPYATYVHENLEIKHPNHVTNPDCGGRAKFLEIALQEFFPNRRVWVETHGFNGVEVSIGINPEYVEYKHYD